MPHSVAAVCQPETTDFISFRISSDRFLSNPKYLATLSARSKYRKITKSTLYLISLTNLLPEENPKVAWMEREQ